MNKKITAALFCSAILLTGCGSSNVKSDSMTVEQNEYQDYNGDYTADDYGGSYDEAAVAEDGDYSGDYSDEGAELAKQTAGVKEAQASKIIYTADICLETLEYDKTVESLNAEIEKAGGFVSYSNETTSDYNNWYNEVDTAGDTAASKNSMKKHMYITLRVPSEKFSEMKDYISGLGQVISSSTQADNVSKQYAETKTQIEALEKEEKRLLEMMDSAKTIDEMITVENRLTDVQTQLNALKTDLSDLDSHVNYSTINVQIDEVRKYTAPVVEPEERPGFFKRVWNRIKGSMSSFAVTLEGLLMLLITVLPYLLTIGLIVTVVLLIITRKSRRARREKRAAEKQKTEENTEKQETDNP